MKKCLKFAQIFSAIGALVTLCAGPAVASTWYVSGETAATLSGANSVLTPGSSTTSAILNSDFYTVSLYNAPAVKSITYDLSGDITTGSTYSAFFDFNPDGGTAAPLYNYTGASWAGASTDTSHGTQYPNILTFNFARGAFQGSDTFGFGAASFWVNNDNSANGSNATDFGNAAIPFTVTFWNGTKSESRNFLATDGVSVVNLQGTVAVVPLPAAAWLFGSGLIGLAGATWRRKRL